MKVTGVVFTYNEDEFINKNHRKTLINIEKMFKIWSQRNLTIIGKIQIIKTFAVSQLFFITNMSNPPPEIITEANKIFYRFIWKGPDTIKRTSMISDISTGGLKMPHLESIMRTQKIMWAKRFSDDNFHPWKIFLNTILKTMSISDITNRKLPLEKIRNTTMSAFNKEMILQCNSTQNFPTDPKEIGNQHIWTNDNIQMPIGNSIHYPLLYKAGLVHIKDLVENGKIIDISIVNNRHITILEKFQLLSTIKCIPQEWKQACFLGIEESPFLNTQ